LEIVEPVSIAHFNSIVKTSLSTSFKNGFEKYLKNKFKILIVLIKSQSSILK